MPRFLTALLIVCGFACLDVEPAAATTYFVDMLAGDDAFDGQAEVPLTDTSGPYRTITRAMRSVRAGDTLNIINRGKPYYESVELLGGRLGEEAHIPIVINGNNCVISGARPIPQGGWELAGKDLWKFSPLRKGWFQLLLNGRPVREIPCPRNARLRPELEPQTWCAWQGSIYYQAPRNEAPDLLPFAYAAEQAGLTVYEVNGAVIRDLTFQHFRIDGINCHDRAREIVFENVNSLENGRSGLAVGGSSQVVFVGGRLQGSRVANLIVSERGAADLRDTDLEKR